MYAACAHAPQPSVAPRTPRRCSSRATRRVARAAGTVGVIAVERRAPRAGRLGRRARALGDRCVLWWLVPLVVIAGASGLGVQAFLSFLWIVAKGHLR